EYVGGLDLGPYQLAEPGDEHHHDQLLDTASRAITGTHHALRVRRIGDAAVLTFKGPNRGSNGLHERDEFEAALPDGGGIDRDRWPQDVAGRVAPLVGDAPLVPIIDVDVHRRTWRVERDGKRVGELALDEGTISAAGRAMPLRELEIELKDGGSRADLEALSQRLRVALPLQPESRSKLERGLALLASAQRLDGHTPLGAWGRHVVLRYLRRVRQTEPAARKRDPDGVHDMRVAIRRLRTTLMILESAPVFDQRRVRGLRRQLKRPARALGEVRDADVLLDRLDAYMRDRSVQADELDVLRDVLVEQREVAEADLLACLSHPKLARLLAAIEELARERDDRAASEPCIEVRHFAGSTLWRRYEDVLAFEGLVPAAEPPSLHRLRIACKRLRYTLELFHPQLGDGAEVLHADLVEAQDLLGNLQDTVVALDIATELRREHPKRAALAHYADALCEERDRLRLAFAPIWVRLSDEPFRQQLAALVAGL
ncbi:MAG TPA: CHAD domain-containing protein, partial [Ktedonobacterales bacterium]|nr:CHAD domain-containing protein [Ktedonobacterales bacterium]